MGTRESSSANAHGNLWTGQKSGAKSNSAVEEAFSSLLTGIVCDALANALGRYVLDILASKGLLDDSDNPKEFDRGLQSLFGNGASSRKDRRQRSLPKTEHTLQLGRPIRL